MEKVNNEKKFFIPNTFKISKRAPHIREMEELWKWLYINYNKKIEKVLEFGCGVTSIVINEAVEPKEYVSVEKFEPCIKTVGEHVKNIKFITTDWSDIPKQMYDLVFVDSCTAPPEGLKALIRTVPMAKGTPFRNDAIHYVKDYIGEKTIVIIHDWNHYKKEWRAHREYLENNNFKLIWSFYKDEGKIVQYYGLGAYIRG